MDKRVLALSKDAEALETIRRVLSEGGYDVSAAASGRAGLELYDLTKPLVVIVTCRLEDMDGLEFVNLLDARQEGMAFVLFICADKRVLSDSAAQETKEPSYKAMSVSFMEITMDEIGLRSIRAMVDQIFYFNDRHSARLANLNSIIELSSAIIIDIDHDGNIAYCNKAAEKTIKYKLEEIISKNFISTLTRNDFRDNNITGLFDHSKSVGPAMRGSPVLKKSIYTIIVDKNKDDLYCKLNFQDIGVGGRSYYRVVLSGVKRVDKLGEVIKFSDVFRVSEIGIAIVDLNNRIIHDNEVIRAIFSRYGIADILGKDVNAIMRLLHTGLDFDSLIKIVEEKQEAKQDIQMNDSGGHISYYTVKVKPLFDGADDLLGCLVIFIDTTEMKESEAAVSTYNAFLEQAIEKVTKAIEKKTVDLEEANERMREEILRRERLEEYLKSSLKDKTILLKEVHHRVKNNLQVITSMLSLQAEDIVDSAVLNIFMDCQSRIRTMALIHDKLYHSDNISVFNFAEYLDDLISDLFHTYRVRQNLAYDVECNVEEIDMDIAISCGLIINEIVSNSLKYAFPDGRSGRLDISFRKLDDGRLEIMVKDDGVGITKDINVQESHSLGMRMIHDLGRRKLKGTVDVIQDNGVTWKIAFKPLAEI